MAIVRLAPTEVQVDDTIFLFATPVQADAFEACSATVDPSHCERDTPPLSKKAVGQVLKIVFPDEPTTAEDGGVYFRAVADGAPVVCHLTVEALEEHFGAREEIRAVDAFLRSRDRIHEIAERMLRADPKPHLSIRPSDVL